MSMDTFRYRPERRPKKARSPTEAGPRFPCEQGMGWCRPLSLVRLRLKPSSVAPRTGLLWLAGSISELPSGIPIYGPLIGEFSFRVNGP